MFVLLPLCVNAGHYDDVGDRNGFDSAISAHNTVATFNQTRVKRNRPTFKRGADNERWKTGLGRTNIIRDIDRNASLMTPHPIEAHAGSEAVASD